MKVATALLILLFATPVGCTVASVTGPHTCKNSVEFQFSGRYGIYETCTDRFGMDVTHKFTGRYADRFVDPTTGEVF